jgi:hypothetical protein
MIYLPGIFPVTPLSGYQRSSINLPINAVLCIYLCDFLNLLFGLEKGFLVGRSHDQPDTIIDLSLMSS